MPSERRRGLLPIDHKGFAVQMARLASVFPYPVLSEAASQLRTEEYWQALLHCTLDEIRCAANRLRDERRDDHTFPLPAEILGVVKTERLSARADLILPATTDPTPEEQAAISAAIRALHNQLDAQMVRQAPRRQRPPRTRIAADDQAEHEARKAAALQQFREKQGGV